jgi:DivIVA domain-containing protein
MDISPHTVRSTSFKTARKGYDTEEVDRFKESVAEAIEAAQNQATAMEARARAAVARLQEMTQAGEGTAGATQASTQPSATVDDHETISRTLLIAQRTAETTVADARAEANHILDSARAQAAQIVEDARAEARKASESEREAAQNEVRSLLAKRDFLLGDTDQLEQHVTAQRERVRAVAASLTDLLDRVPDGLGELRRPLLSAAADDGERAEPATPAAAADEPQTDRREG